MRLLNQRVQKHKCETVCTRVKTKNTFRNNGCTLPGHRLSNHLGSSLKEGSPVEYCVVYISIHCLFDKLDLVGYSGKKIEY